MSIVCVHKPAGYNGGLHIVFSDQQLSAGYNCWMSTNEQCQVYNVSVQLSETAL